MRFNIRGWRIIIFEISSPKYFEKKMYEVYEMFDKWYKVTKESNDS